MSHDFPLARTVGRIRDTAAATDEVPLRAVSDAVGASYTLLFAERITDGGVDAPILAGVDPAYANRLRHAGSLRLLPSWLRALESGTVMDRAALQRDHDFARSPFFDYVVRPEGRFHCVITTPYVTPLQRFHMIVGRPIGRDDFSPADMRVLQALLPHVGSLIRCGTAMSMACDEAAVLQSTLDQVAANVAVVTRDCRLAFANKGAQRLLSLRDGLHGADRRLSAADPADAVALRRAVARAAGGTGTGMLPLRIRRPSGCPPYVLAVRPLDGAAAPRSPACVLVTIGQPDESAIANGLCIARCYGLTLKERDLAVLLASGLDLRAAAERLGMGYNTARFHLRHVFEKTDTRRQSDLVRLVLAASPSL